MMESLPLQDTRLPDTLLFVVVLLSILLFARIYSGSIRILPQTAKRQSGLDYSRVGWSAVWLGLFDFLLLFLGFRLYVEAFAGEVFPIISKVHYVFGAFVLSIFLTSRAGLLWCVSWVLLEKPIQKMWMKWDFYIVTFFSVSLIPLLIWQGAGNQIPVTVLFFWPIGFWLLPKAIYSFRDATFFSRDLGGIIYFILYLCTLEILPVIFFVRVIFS